MTWYKIKNAYNAVLIFLHLRKVEAVDTLNLGKSLGESAIQQLDYLRSSLQSATLTLEHAKTEAQDEIDRLQAEIQDHVDRINEANDHNDRFTRVAGRIDALLA